MIPEASLLDYFTAYHVGLIADGLEAEAVVHPDAPAASALRALAVTRLPWDQRRAEAWDDPTFQPRFEHLRTFVADGEGRSLILSAAVMPFRAFVTHLESLEDLNPF